MKYNFIHEIFEALVSNLTRWYRLVDNYYDLDVTLFGNFNCMAKEME